MGSSFEDHGDLAEYVNVPPLIGMALSMEPMLIEPLSTTLGLEDLHDLLEVRAVDSENERIVSKRKPEAP